MSASTAERLELRDGRHPAYCEYGMPTERVFFFL
jgi:hypothetical protein